MAYFKKFNIRNKVWNSQGGEIKFSTVDNRSGWLRVENPLVVSDLRKLIANEMGGVVEVDAETYEREYEKKTGNVKPSLPRSGREELGGLRPADTLAPKVQTPSKPEALAAPVAALAADEPERPSDRPKPRVGRRVKVAEAA